MKKKFVFILTAIMLCLAFALSACGETGGNGGNGGNDGNGGNGDDPIPAVPTDTLTFEKSTAGEGYIVTGDSGQAANIVIPDEYNGEPVVGIGDSAFGYAQHKSDILSVTIPDSVIEIGRNAFHNQAALVSVKIGENSHLKSIGSNAFSGCSALTGFYLPAGCISLGYDATPASFADEDSEFIDSVPLMSSTSATPYGGARRQRSSIPSSKVMNSPARRSSRSVRREAVRSAGVYLNFKPLQAARHGLRANVFQEIPRKRPFGIG